MRACAAALAYLACLLCSVGGRRVKAKAVKDAVVGITDHIASLTKTEQPATGQASDAAADTTETGQVSDATANHKNSLSEIKQTGAKKQFNPAALLLLALNPTAAAFSSQALPGRFGSLVKENAEAMPKMMYYDDGYYDRYDDYGYGGYGRPWRRGYGNMYGRRGYGNRYGNINVPSYNDGYGMNDYSYGGYGRYGRYDDYGYGGGGGYGGGRNFGRAMRNRGMMRRGYGAYDGYGYGW